MPRSSPRHHRTFSTRRRRNLPDWTDPELLDQVEKIRERAMYPAGMDTKTAQMILFAVLLSHVSPAAEFHARGAMRAGAIAPPRS